MQRHPPSALPSAASSAPVLPDRLEGGVRYAIEPPVDCVEPPSRLGCVAVQPLADGGDGLRRLGCVAVQPPADGGDGRRCLGYVAV